MTALLLAITIVIRLHDAFGIAPGERREAVRRVDTLLQQIGVEADWAICDGDRKNPPDRRCTVAPQPGDIVLRLLHSPKEKFDGALAFGYAVIDAGTGEGTLATVYPDRVERLASTAGVEMADLLGTAMAHEIGHLLLGRTAHSSAGLMREHWRTSEVQRRWSTDWAFSSDEEARIRGRLDPTAAAQLATTRAGGASSLEKRPLEPAHRKPERGGPGADQIDNVPQR